jgi:hypothetical protein
MKMKIAKNTRDIKDLDFEVSKERFSALLMIGLFCVLLFSLICICVQPPKVAIVNIIIALTAAGAVLILILIYLVFALIKTYL